MPDTTVATYLDEPLNVEIDLAPQFSFHLVIAIDNLSNPADIHLAEILDFGIRVDSDLRQDTLAHGAPYTVDGAQSNLDPFALGEVYPCYPCHRLILFVSPLST
jgi:hypothetical protein